MARPKEFDEQEVLRKATEVFWKKGFNGASMQDLVEAMGINRASLYDTFGDKHRLYLSCLRHYGEAAPGMVSDESFRELPARERLKCLFRTAIDELTTDPERKGCFITNAALERGAEDPDTRHLAAHYLRASEALFREIVEKGQQTGEINPALSAQSLAHYWSTLLAGLRVVGKVAPDRAAFERLLDTALRTLD
jgi:TetR/AcrR family transcriptional repressor of nem operon